MASAVPRVLVVEDDQAIRALLLAAFRDEPFDTDAVADGVEAFRLTQKFDYAVILLELKAPGINSLEFLRSFRDACPDARAVILIITDYDEWMLRKLGPRFVPELVPELGPELGPGIVHGIVHKPFDVLRLTAMVREVALNADGMEFRRSWGQAELGSELRFRKL